MASWLEEQERIAREHLHAARPLDALQLIEALIASGYDFSHTRELRREAWVALGLDPRTGLAPPPKPVRQSIKALVAASSADPTSKWPTRDGANRLEPECWPEIRPSFTIRPKAKVFTIGSCFARNVEHHLARLGFTIPTQDFLKAHPERYGLNDANFLNRYTPPSMSQEIAWAKAIADRDGRVRLSDVERYFLPVSGGAIDLQQRSLHRGGRPATALLEERQLLFDLTRQAFDADVVVITLGLIESWFDHETGEYVEFNVAMLSDAYKERFEFRRLRYEEAYFHVKWLLDTLNGTGPKDILITTSPIPMQRTFSGEDVITANTYSKSVLRAVAGAIVEDYPNVDYFPSYESAVLTRKNDIWKDDLVHVKPTFIASIISRVVKSYTTGAPVDQALTDQFITLAGEGQDEQALALFDQIRAAGPLPDSNEFLASATTVLQMSDRHDDARDCLAMARPILASTVDLSAASLIRWAILARNAQEHDLAADLLARVVSAPDKLTAVRAYFTGTCQRKEEEHAAWLLSFVEQSMPGERGLIVNMAITSENQGLDDLAERAYRTALDLEPEDEQVLGRLGSLVFRQRRDEEAVPLLEKALDLNGADPHTLGNLTLALLRLERFQEAAEQAKSLVQLDPSNPYGHFYLARANMRLGRVDDALSEARAALTYRARAPASFGASVETFIAAAERRRELETRERRDGSEHG